MLTVTWNLRSFPSGMCQRQKISGLGFRRMARTVSATHQHGLGRHSDADENTEEIERNARAEDTEPENLANSSYLLENHQLSSIGVIQPMEGTEGVDILLPSVNMCTNIEDMLTG